MLCRNLIIVVLALFPTLLSAALEFESTELQIESDLMDRELEAVFRFSNTGEQAVTISELRSSCGCTVPTLDKKTYAPGESGEIKALFSFGGRTGKQHKAVYVWTDDPGQPQIQLGFSTTIPEWCTISPRLLRWSMSQDPKPLEVSLQVGDPERITVKIDERQLEYFEVKEVANSPERVVYAITPKSPDTRATEKLKFKMVARDGGVVESRDALVYCLIR